MRHMILNCLRSYNAKFRAQYGEMVIACDDRKYWRKDLFPYYKASRKTDREKSEIDWPAVFAVLNRIRDELKDYFPYRVIQIDKAEADDIIGTLAAEFGPKGEKVIIISEDKDFFQLLKYPNIAIYKPIRGKLLVSSEDGPPRGVEAFF